MKTKRIYLKLENLRQNEDNPRLSENTTGEHLLESIMLEGIRDPLLIEKNGNFWTILQGNNRFAACVFIEKLPKEECDFKALFPKGLPCDEVQEWDDANERARVITDHGSVAGLRNVLELCLSTEVLIKSNPALTRGQLVSQLANSIDSLFPLRNAAVLSKLAKAKEKGNKEYMKELIAVRAGVAQMLLQVARGPLLAKEYFLAIARNEVPLVALTREQIGKLYGAHLQDMALKGEDGTSPWSRSNYGPNVLEYIELIKGSNETKASSAAERASKPKPMTATVLKAIQTGAQSKVMKRVLGAMLGELTLDWQQLDGDLLHAEIKPLPKSESRLQAEE
jgi:hypothetical protein